MYIRKKIFKNLISIGAAAALMFSTMTVQAAEPGAGEISYKQIYDYGNGFTFTDTVMNNSTFGIQESYVAQSTPGNGIKPLVLACDTIFGSMDITNVINYAKSIGYNILGAVNSDFFSTSTGIPLGIVVENGIYKSSPEGYSSICFDDNGNASINDYTAVQIKLTNQGGGTSPDGITNMGKNLSLTHFNKRRVNGAGMYLYSSHFSTVSTRTSTDGWAVRMKILNGEMRTRGEMTLQVEELYEGSAPVKIGDGYLVLTADKSSGLDWQFKKFAVGDVVTLETSCYDNEALASCRWASGGGDVILKNGAITNTSSWDQALSGKNPRTAVGIKADGSVVYFTLDGRKAGHSNGISMYQLAAELQALGCVSAINLDGGGSTAISMKLPGESAASIKNIPSDGAARKCSTFILFEASERPDGTAARLHIKEDGLYVYQGTSIDLSCFATDRGYAVVSAPSDVTAAIESGSFGEITDKIYKAPYAAGAMKIRLYSPSTGIEGSGTVHVVQSLDDISVKVNGAAVNSVTVEDGQKIQFTQTASYRGKNVLIGQPNFKYSVSEGFGSISDTGLLTVPQGVKGTGTVTVTSGGVSRNIILKTKSAFADTSGSWAEDYIAKLASKGIVTGSNGYFYPNNNIKRGDFVLMLYRAAGNPDATAMQAFEDVATNDYYAKAVAWAKANGIAKGDGASFNPQSSMSRQDAFTFISRYLVYKGIVKADGTSANLAGFSDSRYISDYAVTATATLVKNNIVNGSDGLINPLGKLSRAEMSKILFVATQ